MNEPRTSIQARIPASTYRLQFNSSFTFLQATELVDYLAELGITDCYASPLLRAKAGSVHGYDVVDHTQLNPELGTEEQFGAFAQALKKKNMGLIVDVVPNHMCISDPTNHWWSDVLENGPSSSFARYFDIDWQPPKTDLHNKVLLPVLGSQYGQALEDKQIQVAYEPDGSFSAAYWEQRYPLAPRTWTMVLEPALRHLRQGPRDSRPEVQELESILYALEHLPRRTETDKAKLRARHREKEFIKKRLCALVEQSPEVAQALQACLEDFNGQQGVATSFDLLEGLLAEQAYRLSYWRVAADEINYRRFFDINDLAAIRVENKGVFAAVHDFVFRQMREGFITGLRIDHIDGLWEPSKYLDNLQRSAYLAMMQACETGPTPRALLEASGFSPSMRPCYLLVEKILEGDEPLRADWPVHGTTGYNALNVLNGVYVEPNSRQTFIALYERFTGASTNLKEVVYQSKKLILEVSLSAELHVLARRLDRISEQHRYSRDFTLNSLLGALREVIACFPVYRSYISPDEETVRPEDRQLIETAIYQAKRRNPAISKSVFDFVHSVLVLEVPEGLSGAEQAERREFILRFQQLTGPVMAKGLEDTAFYRYFPLSSLNEVGALPDAFGLTLEAFHQKNIARLAAWPDAMTASSTHDTKRSEDTRARINVLSEIPNDWERAVFRWREMNRGKRQMRSGLEVPQDNDEYLLYQSLVGAFPFGEMDAKAHEQFVTRIKAYMEKATKEAKIYTSWVNPNEEYDKGIGEFIDALLRPGRDNPFWEDFRRFQAPIARAGAFNSLSQTLLKITCPGVPDFYQGTELWNLRLVDPDNRIAVDYSQRREMLTALRRHSQEDAAGLVRQLVGRLEDGRIKMYVTHKALTFRKAQPKLFGQGDYRPLSAEGNQQEHVIGYARIGQGHEAAIVVAGRFFMGLGVGERLPVGKEVWTNTALRLEGQSLGGQYRELFTGKQIRLDRKLDLATAFSHLPIAVLVRAEK